MRLGRKRGSLWRSTCYESMRLWWLSTMLTQTGSLIRGRIWLKTASTMAYHLAYGMCLGLRWQTCLRGSRFTPALTHCTCLPRRWKHDSPCVPTGVVLGPLILIEISTKDTLPLQGRLRCLRKKSYSHLILNLLTLKPQS